MIKLASAAFLALTIMSICFAEEKTIVVPKDDKPFTVSQQEFVRVSATGIAGSKIDAKIDGPAKLSSTSRVTERVNGHPLIGNATTEFEIQPTGKGTITVTLSVTPPQPGSTAKLTTYRFTVE